MRGSARVSPLIVLTNAQKHKKDGAIPSTFARDTPAPPGATQEEQMTYLGNAWTDSLAKDRVLKPLNTAFKRALSCVQDAKNA